MDETTEGATGDAYAGNYTSMQTTIFPATAMLVSAIKWDIRTAGTYTLRLLYSPGNVASNIKTLVDSQVVSSPGIITFTLPEPMLFCAGQPIYIGLLCASNIAWNYKNAASYDGSDFMLYRMYVNETSQTTRTAPVQLVYRKGNWNA